MSISKILITGASGMLGSEIIEQLDNKYSIIATTHEKGLNEVLPDFKMVESKIDITEARDIAKLMFFKPQFIIHCAAYTDVDGCETNWNRCWRVNVDGTKNICVVAKELNVPLIYISTDFVFDGRKGTLYYENDYTRPINFYGASKLAGEILVQTMVKNYKIIRTSWLYGKNGKNFVDSIIKKAREIGELKVVDDQVGSPTFTKDLARILEKMIDIKEYGVYHFCNYGLCSWYDFAKKTLEILDIDIPILRIKSNELDRPAMRPRFSGLSTDKITQVIRRKYKTLGGEIRHWEEALKIYLGETNDTRG